MDDRPEMDPFGGEKWERSVRQIETKLLSEQRLGTCSSSVHAVVTKQVNPAKEFQVNKIVS